MTTKKKKKKSILQSTFYRVYFALVVLALVGIALGTAWLHGVLRDYESAQPVHVAKDVARLFETSDYGAIYGMDTSAAAIAEGDESFYLQSMRELTAGRDVEWTESFSADPDERNYAVTLDGERFASFTLVPSGQTTAKGNRLWKLGSVTTHVAIEQPEPEATPEPAAEAPEASFQCRLTAPEGYAIEVDGEPLGEGNAAVTRRGYFEDGFLPEGVTNPVIIEYLFDARREDPQIVAADESGNPVDVEPSGEKALTWSCPLREDEAYRQKYGDAALALGRQLAKFTSKDARKKAIQRICAKGSPAAEIFENLYNRFATPHKKVAFRNEAVSEFYVLSDECFTCRVTFDYVLITEKGEVVYPTAYTFCVLNQKGSGKLYNLQIF